MQINFPILLPENKAVVKLFDVCLCRCQSFSIFVLSASFKYCFKKHQLGRVSITSISYMYIFTVSNMLLCLTVLEELNHLAVFDLYLGLSCVINIVAPL